MHRINSADLVVPAVESSIAVEEAVDYRGLYRIFVSCFFSKGPRRHSTIIVRLSLLSALGWGGGVILPVWMRDRAKKGLAMALHMAEGALSWLRGYRRDSVAFGHLKGPLTLQEWGGTRRGTCGDRKWGCMPWSVANTLGQFHELVHQKTPCIVEILFLRGDDLGMPSQ